MKLASHFYLRDDVVLIAKELLGKTLFTCIDGLLTGGTIIETEAYRSDDRACHAYNKRRTPRTEVMFQDGGIAYVYLCYGMHNLLNVVTAPAGNPQAVLIRAIHPTAGLSHMRKRRGKGKKDSQLVSGPGALTQALGISRDHNGVSLGSKTLWIEDGEKIDPSMITITPRIGIDYAGEDAKRPWRFVYNPL